MRRTFAFGFAVLLVANSPCGAEDSATLGKLADDFWTWRAKYAPFTGDDVNRIERPDGMRDWSRGAIDRRGDELSEFVARWKKIHDFVWKNGNVPIALQRWEYLGTPKNRDPRS